MSGVLGIDPGVTGAFRFGGIFFGIKAVLACCDIPVQLVTAAKWKKHYGLIGSDKERSRKKAIELFPDQVNTLQLKKHHAKAEAMLIAAYGAHNDRHQKQED